MGPLKGGASRESLESWLMSWGELCLGPEGRQPASQTRPASPRGDVVFGSAALQSRFCSDLRAGASANMGEEARANYPHSSYTSPGKACIIRQGRSITPWRISSDNFIRLILKLQAENQTDNLQQTFAGKKKIHRAQNI